MSLPFLPMSCVEPKKFLGYFKIKGRSAELPRYNVFLKAGSIS